VKADVVVVGAGPAGASAAIRLAREGYDVALVDRARFPRAKPCGEFLSPGATPILEDLGVRDAIEAAGALRLERVRIDAHGASVELDFPDDLGAPAWGYSLSRFALDAILVEAARRAGARVLEGTRVEAVRLGSSRPRVRARGADGEPLSIECALVIGAGGRACPVARAIGPGRRLSRARFDLLAHWSDTGGGAATASRTCDLVVRGDRYVARAPVEGGRWNVNCVVPRSELRATRDAAGLYRRIVAGLAPPETTPDECVSASDVTSFLARRATADGALLVGDAALFLDPFTGQGIWLALRSSALAAHTAVRALASGRCDRAALSGYDAARAAEFAARDRVSRTLQAILYRPTAARWLVRALVRDRPLARTLAAATGDLSPSERVWSTGFGARLLAAGMPFGAPALPTT
jgi:flavin-dependent dehydrogenase